MKVIQIGKRIKSRNEKQIKFLLIVIILSSIECGQSKKDVYEEPDLIGASLIRLLDSLGTPYSNTEINITKGVNLYEYQSRLLSLYGKNLEKDTIVLKEVIWKDSKESKCFWFEQKENGWFVIDNLFWKKGIKF